VRAWGAVIAENWPEADCSAVGSKTVTDPA
jgi:hypothetical protein